MIIIHLLPLELYLVRDPELAIFNDSNRLVLYLYCILH